jgi:hypothetical protein
MILSQVFALIGMHTFPLLGGGFNFNGDYWWMGPIHVALYLIHMTQEMWDYHDGTPWFEKIKKGGKKVQ